MLSVPQAVPLKKWGFFLIDTPENFIYASYISKKSPIALHLIRRFANGKACLSTLR
jgi:hypothetical protein